MEAALARSESSVVQVTSHIEDELQRKERQGTDLREQLQEIQDLLEQEKQANKEIKKQVLECGEYCKLCIYK